MMRPCRVQYLSHTGDIVYMLYILHLTYISRWRSVERNRVCLLPSQLLWNYPDYLMILANVIEDVNDKRLSSSPINIL